MSPRPTALITGGSSGIGLAIAHELADRGYDLLLVSIQEKELEACRQALEQQYGICCHTLYCDLAQPGAAREIYDHCTTNGLAVEVLVNNAGILLFSEVVEAPEDKVRAILQLHMQTPTLLCRLFGADMKQKGKGYILNISSLSAVMPYPGISLYGPTKTYMRYFTQAFRNEMKMYGVHVTCVLPGATATALYDTSKVNVSLAMRLGVMQTADYVAAKAVKALFSNKGECIPGWLNKLGVAFLPRFPSSGIRWLRRNTAWMEKGKATLG